MSICLVFAEVDVPVFGESSPRVLNGERVFRVRRANAGRVVDLRAAVQVEEVRLQLSAVPLNRQPRALRALLDLEAVLVAAHHQVRTRCSSGCMCI